MKQIIFNIDFEERKSNKLREYKEKISVIEKSLGKYVCPIYSIDEKEKLKLLGSAVLIRMNIYNFLITAAHVLKENKESTLYLFGKSDLVELKGTAYSTPFENANHSKIEFSFMHLDESTVKELIHFDFLDISFVEPNDFTHQHKLYTFVGYPGTKNKPRPDIKTVKRSIFVYSNSGSDNSLYKHFKVEPYSHIIVGYEKEKGINNQGEILTMPDPYGMSGGGVWNLTDFNQLPISFIPKLVGIGLEYHQDKKCLIALNMPIILEGIKHYFPQLKSLIPQSKYVKVNISK